MHTSTEYVPVWLRLAECTKTSNGEWFLIIKDTVTNLIGIINKCPTVHCCR
jgi:hypothetical protein